MEIRLLSVTTLLTTASSEIGGLRLTYAFFPHAFLKCLSGGIGKVDSLSGVESQDVIGDGTGRAVCITATLTTAGRPLVVFFPGPA